MCIRDSLQIFLCTQVRLWPRRLFAIEQNLPHLFFRNPAVAPMPMRFHLSACRVPGAVLSNGCLPLQVEGTASKEGVLAGMQFLAEWGFLAGLGLTAHVSQRGVAQV